MSTYLYSGRVSNGGRELAQALGVQRIRHENSRFRGNSEKIVINWGSRTDCIGLAGSRVINWFNKVDSASHKTCFFSFMPSDIIPEYTRNHSTAEQWLSEGFTVVSRAILRGHSAHGLEVHEPSPLVPPSLPQVPLYTKYFRKTAEYRVHIAFGAIIDVQKKMRRLETPDHEVNWQVRNLENGFIYGREGFHTPDRVLEYACRAHEATGLDFGAYDVCNHMPSRTSVVLEVNTAPGLTGTTLERYTECFKRNLGL